jgi:hypothetical protein
MGGRKARKRRREGRGGKNGERKEGEGEVRSIDARSSGKP